MLFLTYFQLNEETPLGQRLEVGQKLTTSGQFPPPGVTIIRWDITPDGWGVLAAEANDAAAISQAINTWRAALPGFFTATHTAPALPVLENMQVMGKLLQRMAG